MWPSLLYLLFIHQQGCVGECSYHFRMDTILWDKKVAVYGRRGIASIPPGLQQLETNKVRKCSSCSLQRLVDGLH